MKGSMNCSRRGNANHIERRFNITKADHIDKDKVHDNVYLYFGGGEKPVPKFLYSEDGFKKMELAYYEKTYKDSLDRKNQNYLKKGNYKYIKSIEDLYNAEKTKPEELILQYGNKYEHPDPEVLIKAFEEYLEAFNQWNREHGNHIKILDAALHLDEQTPHWHVRRVFEYDDKYGNKDICIKRALEQAGVTLPDTTQAEGRFNNLKMHLDAVLRDLWINIGRHLGLELDNAPKIGSRGALAIQEYKKNQINKDIDKNTNYLDKLNEEITEKETYADKLTDIIEEIASGALDTAYDIIDQITNEERGEIER